MTPYPVWLIGKSVLIEALRRREIYVIVLLAVLMIGMVMELDFFGLGGLAKFYRETALKIMSWTTGLTVIILSTRQLPREFEHRTIYPLLAKPVSREAFLLGKLLGVLMGAGFCFTLFMLVYVVGTWMLKGDIPWIIFLQYIYLQMVLMLVLATLGFCLSMMFTLGAAVSLGILLFILSATVSSATIFLYQGLNEMGRGVILLLTFLIPQFVLFDLSEKTVHSEYWEPLSFGTLGWLTLYGAIYALIFLMITIVLFRRKPL